MEEDLGFSSQTEDEDISKESIGSGNNAFMQSPAKLPSEILNLSLVRDQQYFLPTEIFDQLLDTPFWVRNKFELLPVRSGVIREN